MQSKAVTYELLEFIESITVLLKKLLNSFVLLLIRRGDDRSQVEVEVVHHFLSFDESSDSFLKIAKGDIRQRRHR